MVAYKVRDWKKHYERNHKDTEVVFRWIAVPTRHDGKGYRRLAQHPDKVEVFCAFNLIIQVAAKMPTRGILVDEECALDAQDLSDATGYPVRIFEKALDILTNNSFKIGWLEKFEYEQVRTSPDLSRYRTGQNNTPQHIAGGVSNDDEMSDPPGFLRFWAAWPKHERKANRKACLKRWISGLLEPLAEEILHGLSRWKASAQWAKDGGQFIPAPLVWLNQDRWTAADALDPAVKGPGDNGFERKPMTREVAEAIGAPWPLVLADGSKVGEA